MELHGESNTQHNQNSHHLCLIFGQVFEPFPVDNANEYRKLDHPLTRCRLINPHQTEYQKPLEIISKIILRHANFVSNQVFQLRPCKT